MTFTIAQNDTLPPIQSSLKTNDGSYLNMDVVDNIQFQMEKKRSKELVVEDDLGGRVGVLDTQGTTVEYQWFPGDTSDVGRYVAQWVVTYIDGRTERFPNEGKIDVKVTENIDD